MTRYRWKALADDCKHDGRPSLAALKAEQVAGVTRDCARTRNSHNSRHVLSWLQSEPGRSTRALCDVCCFAFGSRKCRLSRMTAFY